MFQSKFKGHCPECNQSWAIGDYIERKGKIYVHATCLTPTIRNLSEPQFAPLHEPMVQETDSPSVHPQLSDEQELNLLKAVALQLANQETKLNAKLAQLESERLGIIHENTKLIGKLDTAISLLDTTRKTELEIRRYNAPTITMANVHMQFSDLINVVSTRNQFGYLTNCYLYGAPGGFKSTAAKALAKALNLPYDYISLNETTQEHNIIGYTAPNLSNGEIVNHTTPFTRLYESGGVLLIDEMDNTTANALTALNGALENGLAAFPWGLTKRHKDFVCIGTGNTPGRGATPMFPERRALDSATMSRFWFMQWMYDWSIAESIALNINPNCGEYIAWVKRAHDFVFANNLRVEMSPRTMFKLASMTRNENVTSRVLIEGIMQGLDNAGQSKLLNNVPFPVM